MPLFAQHMSPETGFTVPGLKVPLTRTTKAVIATLTHLGLFCPRSRPCLFSRLFAASVMAALATAHRQAGDLDTAAQLFTQLYGINAEQSEGGAANQSGVMLARTLVDIYQEAEKDT